MCFSQTRVNYVRFYLLSYKSSKPSVLVSEFRLSGICSFLQPEPKEADFGNDDEEDEIDFYVSQVARIFTCLVSKRSVVKASYYFYLGNMLSCTCLCVYLGYRAINKPSCARFCFPTGNYIKN
jgi:hypothetical protein